MCAKKMSKNQNSLTDKAGDLPASPMTVEESQKSMGTKDNNSQSSLSSIAHQYLHNGQVPIEAVLRTFDENRKRFKVLMLGSSGSGKTTLLKSMTICCEEPYGPVERKIFKEAIYSNLVEDIRTIFDVMKTFNIEVASRDSHDHFRKVMKATHLGSNGVPDDVAFAIKALWDDSGVQAGFQRSNNCRLNDSCG